MDGNGQLCYTIGQRDAKGDNNMLEEFEVKLKQAQERYGPILEQLRRHEIPESYPEADGSSSLFGAHSLDEGSLLIRDEGIHLCGFCWLSYNWIRPLAHWIGSRRCLEIMCGSGALSYALQTCGVQVAATDSFGWEKNFSGWYERPWTDIQQVDCLEAIRTYGTQTDLVICSWPYMDDTCYQALLEMRKANPTAHMLYIGEPAGGATASKAFFEAVESVEDEGFEESVQEFRSAFMLKDRPMLFR